MYPGVTLTTSVNWRDVMDSRPSTAFPHHEDKVVVMSETASECEETARVA